MSALRKYIRLTITRGNGSGLAIKSDQKINIILHICEHHPREFKEGLSLFLHPSYSLDQNAQIKTGNYLKALFCKKKLNQLTLMISSTTTVMGL